MGFLSGRVTWLRFRVSRPAPAVFDQAHLDAMAAHAAGTRLIAMSDGSNLGWVAGGHALDTDFGPEKNIVNDALHFELRVDTDKPPADLLKAYYEVELKALSKDNPSGFPSARQKREAKETARKRIEEEANDGRFRKRKCVSVLWDRAANEVLFGATSLTHVERFAALFEQTFALRPFALTAGVQSVFLAEHAHARFLGETAGMVAEPTPSPFVPGTTPADVAWIADESDRSFLGNEFLLWLWWYTDQSDTLALPDRSEAVVMFARSLVLDCPRGVTGVDGFKHEMPTRLPECRKAIQAGKLPRRAGLTVVRHDRQYEFTLHAETLAVGSAKLPPPDEDTTDARAKLDERVQAVRDLRETIDGLYSAFLARRLTAKWGHDLAEMQGWLGRAREAA